MASRTKLGVISLSGAALLVVAACSRMPTIPNPLELVSGPAAIHVEVPPRPAATPILRSGQPISLLVSDYADARPTAPARRIGDIRATVANMHGSELTLDRDIAAVVSAAVRNQLQADGFRLVGSPGDGHDFTVSGETRALVLNIAGRDELNIVTQTTLRSGKTGEVLWAGIVTEKSDRFAGVNGNTRASITEYLGEGLAELAAKTSASIREGLAKSYPHTIVASQRREISAVPGVTIVQAPADRESAVAGTATAENPRSVAATSTGTGHFSVATIPSRAKVYVDDVYYGMSPLKIALAAGVHRFTFKLDGYKAATEKVSVRQGETTELEVKFEK